MGKDKDKGLFRSLTKKDVESKTMEESTSKTMEEPSSMVMEDPKLEKKESPKKLKEEKVEVKSKSALSGHPIAKNKHSNVMSQKPVNSRKYFKSK